MKTIKIALAALGLSLGLTGQIGAQGKTSTLCWAAWDPANALVELSKDFTAKSGVNMKFKFVPCPNFADRMLNELNSKGQALRPPNRANGEPHRRDAGGPPRASRHAARDLQDARLDLVATRLGNPGINLVPRAAFPELAVLPGTVSLGARTENIRLTRANGGASGRIRWIEHLGDQNHLHIEMGKHSLVTLVAPEARTPKHRGGHRTRPPLCFDADGNRIRT
jgi:hypothetical protein